MQIIAVAIGLIFIAAAIAVPGAWLTMLALGNFGFSQFGLVDCLPAGAIIGMLSANK